MKFWSLKFGNENSDLTISNMRVREQCRAGLTWSWRFCGPPDWSGPPCEDIPPAVVELSELQFDSFESVLRMNASLGSCPLESGCLWLGPNLPPLRFLLLSRKLRCG